MHRHLKFPLSNKNHFHSVVQVGRKSNIFGKKTFKSFLFIFVERTTRFPVVDGCHTTNKVVDMPVAWTKFWGNGRVFYCSLGHHDDVFEKSPSAAVLMERGMPWAAAGKAYARENNLVYERFLTMV